MSKVMKPKRTIKRLDVWEVSGRGTRDMGEYVGAPPDMLRYDRAFKHRDPASPFGRFVVLPTYSVRNSGTKPGKATLARWASFSTTLTKVTDPETIHTVTSHLQSHQRDWITFVHNVAWGLDEQTYEAFTQEV